MKKNRRTLKKRIRNIIFLCFLSTILLMGSFFYIFVYYTIKNTSTYLSLYIGNTIAAEIGSVNLDDLGISDWRDFDKNSEAAVIWKEKIDSLIKVSSASIEDKVNPYRDGAFTIDISIADGHIYTNNFFYMVEIEMLGVEVYSNASSVEVHPLIDRMYAKLYNPLINNIYDNNGNVIGVVKSQVNPMIGVIVFLVISSGLLIIILVILVLARLLANLFAIPIVRPLKEFEKALESSTKDSDSHIIDDGIVLKKPLKEIESLNNVINKIMYKMSTYSTILKNQKEELENQYTELEAQNEELNESQIKIKEAQEQLIKKEKDVRLLLDNAGQGFLSCGADLMVHNEYSAECVNIFGKSIEDTNIGELIYPNDIEQRNFLEALMLKLLKEEDKNKQEIYSTLLPNEAEINNRHIHLEYKIIQSYTNPMFMIILTDISEKRQLQHQIDMERKILKMVVKVVTERELFLNCVQEYQDFYSNSLFSILESNSKPEEILYSIFRSIHTFKGVFCQLEMIHIVEHLHQVETALTSFNKGDSLDKRSISDYITSCNFYQWLEEDISVLKEFLYEDFFVINDSIVIEKDQVKEIEKKMIKILPSAEYSLLVTELRKLLYQPFSAIIQPYVNYVAKLSERMEKPIYPMQIEGGDFLLDIEKYRHLSKSLVHIFRNIFEHGIETIEERLTAGKDEFSSIICSMSKTDDYYQLIIMDDGAGIDLKKVKDRALSKGIVSITELEKMKEADILKLIFVEEFSTREYVSYSSGRGVGLSAVDEAVKLLNGNVEVKTQRGVGCKFIINLPLESVNDSVINMKDLITPTINKAKNYLGNLLPNTILQESTIQSPIKNLKLNEYTAFVELKGIFNGWFTISLDRNLSMEIVRGFTIDDLTDDEENQYLEDVISEAANTIIGNSLGDMGHLGEMLHIESPIIIFSKEASLKCINNEIWSYDFFSDKGNINISFIMLK